MDNHSSSQGKDRPLVRKSLLVIFFVSLLGLIVLASFQPALREFIADRFNLRNYIRQSVVYKNPRTVEYQWKYNGQQFSLKKTLYQSVDDYYEDQPDSFFCLPHFCPRSWRKVYFNMFFEEAENDQSIDQLVNELKEMGEKKDFNKDQIAEFVVAFVQSIPYDFEKSVGNDSSPRYPYEVLYDNRGVCSGKSFLMASMVNKLGYGVSLMDYEADNHLAVGIKCTSGFSNYDSGYCYTETTFPTWKIGIRYTGELMQLKDPRVSKITSRPDIFPIAEGKTYQRVEVALEKKQKAISLQQEIKNLNQQVDQQKQRLNQLSDQLDTLQEQGKHKAYNELVPQYNNLLSDYEMKVNLVNQKIEEYNQIVNYFSP